MEIINKKISELKPYENNPRINDEAVQYVRNSIEQFGFKVPIIIDKNNVVIAGHTRLKAAEEIGMKDVPCIIADDLTDEQVKAFRLADNKVSEKSMWDYSKLDEELNDILDIDMSMFDFDISSEFINEDENEPFLTQNEEESKENERPRTNSIYTLDIYDSNNVSGPYQMPIIENDNFIPAELIGFNFAKTNENKFVGVHFYLDDYQFERIWNNPKDYIEILQQYDCIFSPDFSLYQDMPLAMKIWNVYRSRLIGQFYQGYGIKVIPTVSWADEDTFDFCFDGIPEGSIVTVSTLGIKKSKTTMEMWKKGMDKLIEKVKPTAILIYGGQVDYDFKSIKTIYYENDVIKRLEAIDET